jgi:hypothetical protein
MSRIKSALWDELLMRQARGDEPMPCPDCDSGIIEEDDLCRDCWNETNGQFGVGA